MTTKEKLSFPEIGLIVGVPGAIAMMIGLPVFLHFVWYSCAYHRCSEVAAMRALWQSPVSAFKKMFPIPSVFSIYAVCGWYLFLVLQHILLPGKMKEGYPTAPDGRRYIDC